MSLIKILVFQLAIFGILNVPTYSQVQGDISEVTKEAIKEKLRSKFNQDFLISAYNKKESPTWKTELGFSDPYGTLSDGYIFLARPFGPNRDENPNGFVGIYKSGAIIWQSEREVNADIVVNMELLGTMDLNRDGKVEIITQWYMGMRGGNTDLWIYTWDGTIGERINHLAKEDKSVIEATVASVEIVDVEPDGIKEIIGEDRESTHNVYSWNGQEYGNWGVSLPDPLPRNGIKADIWANVKLAKDPDKLIFSYIIRNKKESLQPIEEFAVKNYFVISENKIKPNNWRFRKINKRHLVGWQVELFLEQQSDALLKPEESDSSFSFITTGLPRPATYYVQGNNGDLSLDSDDLVTNSVTGITLGPYNPPDPFDAGIFTDSLRSFSAQACELEWITNNGICKSLEVKLDNVARQLQRGNTKTAANNVQAFLNEVEAVRRNHLTSEGYGLLYYNAKYLLEKLDEESGK